MKTFIVTFDSNVLDDVYPQIREKLQAYPKWACATRRAWLIQAEKKTTEIRDEIKACTNEEVHVLVMNVSNSAWATYAISKSVTNWMKENM